MIEVVLFNAAGGLLFASALVRVLRVGTSRMMSLIGCFGMVLLVVEELTFGWTVGWVPSFAAGMAALMAHDVVTDKGPFLVRRKARSDEG